MGGELEGGVGVVVEAARDRRIEFQAFCCNSTGSYGGEEFLLILPQSDESGALRVAERLRERWREESFGQEGGPNTVSLSVGVAACQEDETIDELLNRADQGLYKAKSGGRDQSRVA